MKRHFNEESKNNKAKKLISRQKSINPNIEIIHPSAYISQRKTKQKIDNSIELSPILTVHNEKLKKNKTLPNHKKDSIIINNESSYLLLESFLNEHQIKYNTIFILYLSEIWRELSLYSSDYNLGVIPFAFSRYFPLPGLISKRLFDVLDINKDGYLSPKEFIQGLSIIYCEEIFSLIKFIFIFYDFDNDGYITSEDIHAIMSYIPVINSFSDMIDIEEEIQNTLEEIFADDKNKLNLNEFTDLIINKERYEIFIPIICFFFEQKPFSNQEIEFFYKDMINDNINNNQNIYKIDGKIKLKVEKDENIGKAYEDKIILDFKKNKYDEIINKDDSYDKYNHFNKKDNFRNDFQEKEMPHNNNNIILINNERINLSNGSSLKNNNNNINKSINSTDSYGDNNNNINIIESNYEEEENNENSRPSKLIKDNLNDNLNNELDILKKVTTFGKQESNNSSNLPPKENYKTYSRQNSVRDIKLLQQKVISRFGNNEEIINKDDHNNIDEINNEENKDDISQIIERNMKSSIRNRTKSMRNIKYKKENLKDLVSKSKGFKHLEKSIPSLINKTKILAKYSSRNIKIMDNEGLNQFKKGNVIKNLCKNKINLDNDNNNNEHERKNTEDSYEIERNEDNEFIGIKLINDNKQNDENEKTNNINNKNENKEKITYESYLYKITPNSKKLKKLYFKLYNKNLYYYKNENSHMHKGMHNLCHYFLELSEESEGESEESSIFVEKNNNSYKEDDESFIDSEKKDDSDKNKSELSSEIIIKKINSIDYYCFILISQKGKIQWYLTPDKEKYDNWVDVLKNVMNYKDVLDRYEFKEVIGKGKFSIVYCAYDKEKKRKVAIKRIDKTILKLSELELIKTEIDILRICQHPYVIGLYDVIETYSSMDIVLEYCQIGNLYNYLCKKDFKLPEQEIVTYIHKISKAVYSMHNLGIIHRDLKLSNIAMADGNEHDIRILDFGLSKIIGPGETCSESYGTPGYAAPEVINEEKYRFKADVWSIGAISYFMCTSTLPYDYPTKGLHKTNIVINTLNDDLKFNQDCWKKFSKESIKFIKDCMNKNTEKRLTIKQVLEHEWIKKYFYREVKNRESCRNVVDLVIGGKKITKRIERQKSYQKRISSMATNYRLYADISG